MKKKFIHIILSVNLFIVLIIPFQLTFSQFHIKVFQNNADTIYRQLGNAPAEKLIYLYDQLAFYYSFENADSCFLYAEKALKLALDGSI